MAAKKKKEQELIVPRKHYKPREVYDMLNEFVIGQDEAKRTLSVAISDHQKRVLWNVYGAFPGKYKIVNKETEEEISDEDFMALSQLSREKYKLVGDEEFEANRNTVIEKSNILLLGSTGTGKTYMLKQIAKRLGIPCYIADTTKITQAGYVGDDVENVVLGLLREANMIPELAQEGIIILDEIDKIGRKGDNPSITRDVGGEGVQQALLKMVEGGVIGVPRNGGRKHPEQELVYVDTSNILFVGLGSFDGITKIIERRLNTKTVGFIHGMNGTAQESGNILSHVTPQDLKSFGLIPELIGRFPVITFTNDLTKEDMVRIIKEPKNCILRQQQKLFEMDGNTLTFTDDAIELIAEKTLETKTGARGLRGTLETVLTKIKFETDGNGIDVVIDKDYVEEALTKNGRQTP